MKVGDLVVWRHPSEKDVGIVVATSDKATLSDHPTIQSSLQLHSLGRWR